MRLGDELEGDDGDEREGGDVEEEEGGERPEPGGARRVDEVEEDVDGLDDAAEGVDGQQRAGVGLHQRVEYPQRAAEERHHVRHAAEPLRRLLPVHAQERRPEHSTIRDFLCQILQKLATYTFTEWIAKHMSLLGEQEQLQDHRSHAWCTYVGARNTRKETMLPAQETMEKRWSFLSVINEPIVGHANCISVLQYILLLR